MYVDFNILNQLGSPAINSNTLANRPAAGYTGRLFVSIDTFALYRDNGTGWDLIGGPGTGTVTGAGVATRVAFWDGTSSISSNANLYWDNTNSRLGIGTATPGTKLDIHGTGTIATINATGANNSYLEFSRAGTGQYLIGFNYNGGTNSHFQIYDSTGLKNVIGIDKTSRKVGINFQFTGTGDLPLYTLDVYGSGRYLDQLLLDNAGSNSNTLNIQTSTTGITYKAAGYVSIGAFGSNRLSVVFGDNNSYIAGFYGGSLTASRAYTLPDNSGTLALTSDIPSLSGYVPYTGATTNVSLGAYYLTASSVITSGGLSIGNNYTLSARNFADTAYLPLIGLNTSNQVTIDSGGQGAIFGGSINAITETLTNGGLGLRINNTGGANSTYDAFIGSDISYIYFGNYANNRGLFIDQSNGNSIFKNGNVGIGTSSPATPLAIKGASNNTLIEMGNFSTNSAFIQSYDRTSSVFRPFTMYADLFTFETGGSERMRITSGGNVLVGTTTDNGYKFQVQGDIFATDASTARIFLNNTGGGNNWNFNSYTNGNLYLQISGGTSNLGVFSGSTGVYTPLSDINKKKDFEKSNIGLSEILKLSPTLYRMLSDNENTDKQLGFIAQEVKEHIPQAYVENGEFIGLNYNAIIAALVKAVQELNDKIK